MRWLLNEVLCWMIMFGIETFIIESRRHPRKIRERERERERESVFESNVFMPPAHPSTATTDIRLV